MLHRSHKIGNNNIGKYTLFFVVFFFLFCFCSVSPARAENGLIKFYQDHISAVDGNRCQMYPSCSSYASKAIEKHGLALGWVMTMDRLVRCGRDEEKVSIQILVNNQEHIYDPVKNNDFWWFENKKK